MKNGARQKYVQYTNRKETICENYRGISLMCHFANLYESVLKPRLRRATDDKIGPRQQVFRKGVGTCDMIFALRQLIEKIWNLINLCTSHFWI